MADIRKHMAELGSKVNTRLTVLMDDLCEPGILKDAMSYSLMAGGKRLRPVLCMMAAGMYGDENDALDLACAIEMIHTYSLIHDDLPAMDNDDLRRGKPTNHRVFGEAYAILAGDGLLNSAFEVMFSLALQKNDGAWAARIVSEAAGVRGMIAGQCADMEFEGTKLEAQTLEYIHERKTAALIKASVMSGAALMGAMDEELKALGEYGANIGLAFQIMDDILDESGDELHLGKTPGKDKAAFKQTYSRLYGIEQSKLIAEKKTQNAREALNVFGNRAQELKTLAEILLIRES